MKNIRTSVVLEMAFRLLDGQTFTEEAIRNDFSISRSTFYRGLSDVRCFLIEHRPFYELVYDPKMKAYVLTKVSSSNW